MQLRDIELFYSLAELTDFYTCQQVKQHKHISEWLDILEDAHIETRRLALRNINLSLHSYDKSSFYLSETSALCIDLLERGGLGYLISQLSLISHSILASERDIEIEQDLRMCLNILYTILSLVPLEDILPEIGDHSELLEEILIQLIKLSTEISFIPIKKVTMLLEKYLQIYFQEIDTKSTGSIYSRLIDTIPLDKPRVMSTAKNNVELFYRRLMKSELNLSNFIVVGLLRSLLQTFPGSPPTGVDLKQEWISAINLYKQSNQGNSVALEILCKCDTCDDYTHQEESNRHKLIVAHYISKTLNLMLKMFRQNDTLQYLYLSILLADANAIIVLLKFLSQDLSNYVNDTESNVIPDTVDLKQFIYQTICETLQLIRKILKFNKEKLVSHFIEYKGPLLIKRLYNTIPDSNVKILTLKLLRSLIKFMPKTWKTYPSNLRFMSAIYLTLDPKDNDWISGSVNDYMSHEELKQITKLYNYHHYSASKKRISISEEEFSDEFKQNYEQWLEDNVWGVTFSNL